MTTLLGLIIVLAIFGVICWLILTLPMPAIVRNLVIAAIAIACLLFLYQMVVGGRLALP